MPHSQKPLSILSLGMPVCGQKDLCLPKEFLEMAADADVLVGGKRYLAACPEGKAERLPVAKDVDALCAILRKRLAEGKRIVVLAGGNGMFFGIGAKLIKEFGSGTCCCIPGPSSLDAAAAFLGISPHNLTAVSLHGRDAWFPLAHALLDEKNIFLLTDSHSSPSVIADYLLERGCTRYGMCVLDNLCKCSDGGFQAGAFQTLTLEQATTWTGQKETGGVLRSIVLLHDACEGLPEALHKKLFPCPRSTAGESAGGATPETDLYGDALIGIPDELFDSDNGLITKKEIRAAGIAALRLAPAHTVWDLGAGSGAVGIEVSRLVRKGRVFAVEQHPHRVEMIRRNRQKFTAANLEIIPGEAADVLHMLPMPDRIFLGGGLGGSAGDAKTLLKNIWTALRPGGILVAHCVLLSSLERARHVLRHLGATVLITHLQASRSAPLGQDVFLRPGTPVCLVAAIKE